jgi:hypothetical protein
MCLKLYHRYTFSNRYAYERLLRKLFKNPKSKRYGMSDIRGQIKVVREWQAFKTNGWDWDKFSFEELQRMEYVGGFFQVWYYQFHDWKSLKETIRKIGGATHLFGEVVIELY